MNLNISTLREKYRKKALFPASLLNGLHDLMEARGDDGVWISRVPRDELEQRAAALENAAESSSLPLAGVPFAIKDNIDLSGLPTTAACPEYSYSPTRSATVVDRLLAAGAVPLGKTNMDQFATGLVGVRSPYGIAKNPYGADFIPGGSSSGSAVAVASGLCSFALGTDTAGSGRVPAAFNNLVGLKPTRGLLSTRGVVPACRSLDCVSIFTRSVNDASEILRVTAAQDPEDSYSRVATPPLNFPTTKPRIGVPRASELEFFGDESAAALFQAAIERWSALGAVLIEVSIAPLLEAARLLYEGPWVAERYAALKPFLLKNSSALHPVTRDIIAPAATLGATSAFEAFYRLSALQAKADLLFASFDALLLPTTPTIYRISQVLADPIRLNSRLGTYTNFMNLLDLCGLALPAGFLANKMPWGVTLAAPAFHDDRLLGLGALFLGESKPSPALTCAGPFVELAVCGAHLSGLPLNWQLTTLGARLKRRVATVPEYAFYRLAGTVPAKPGLIHTGPSGHAIEVEVWDIPVAAYGFFVSQIPSPLGIGTLKLADGSRVQGFLCEHSAIQGQEDISHLGGWRHYLNKATPNPAHP